MNIITNTRNEERERCRARLLKRHRSALVLGYFQRKVFRNRVVNLILLAQLGTGYSKAAISAALS